MLVRLASCKESGQVATLASWNADGLTAAGAIFTRGGEDRLASRGDVRVKASVCDVRQRIQGPASAKLMEI
ncbi:hypothetical protein [Granulicella aggregans]|uniref:hypothetical protein n=1 Tax=Granulicella aggregans TaxID=474949 RepID=UPI0021DF612A|nr:hypothetical protein [Granulicella aggregans]